MQEGGLRVPLEERDQATGLPVPRDVLAASFRAMPDGELGTTGLWVLATKEAGC